MTGLVARIRYRESAARVRECEGQLREFIRLDVHPDLLRKAVASLLDAWYEAALADAMYEYHSGNAKRQLVRVVAHAERVHCVE